MPAEPSSSPPLPPCPYCQGEGKVRGTIDDIEFEFDCVCNGGHPEAVQWLLSAPEDYAI